MKKDENQEDEDEENEMVMRGWISESHGEAPRHLGSRGENKEAKVEDGEEEKVATSSAKKSWIRTTKKHWGSWRDKKYRRRSKPLGMQSQ